MYSNRTIYISLALSTLGILFLSIPSLAFAATSVPAGTDTWTSVITGGGSYTLAAGTHTLTSNVLLPQGVTLTADPGATVIISNVSLFIQSNSTISGIPITINGASGKIALIATSSSNAFQHDVTFQNNTITGSGGTQGFYAGQGFNSFHRNINILNNTFTGATVYVEIGNNFNISGNTFGSLSAGAVAVHLSEVGSSTISSNRIDGGINGILFLSRNDVGTVHIEPIGNIVTNNILTNITTEGISFDSNANTPAATGVREYDTIAFVRGSNKVDLSSTNWVSQTTYTGSKYHLAFVSGALAGKQYMITTENGSSTTLSIPSADYALIQPGDGITISTMAANNLIANNTVLSNQGTAIMFWGRGYDDTVSNNILQTVGPYSTHAIQFASLNGIASTTSITGLKRRMPVGFNAATNNDAIAGDVLVNYYNNYDSGGTADYTPVYTPAVNTTTSDPLLAALSLNDFHLTYLSPAIDAGVATTTRTTDYYGNPIYGAPDLGAIEYQPPYIIGTDSVSMDGNIRVYGNGKYRYMAATTTAASANFQIVPQGGWPAGSYAQYYDVKITNWQNSGTYAKSWTASSPIAGNTVFTIGNLNPNQLYQMKVDGSNYTQATANSSGIATFTYTAGWSTHSFDVNAVPATCALAIDKTSVSTGDLVVLTWTSTHGISASIDQGVGSVPLNGSVTSSLNRAGNQTYSLAVTGADGVIATCSVSLAVKSREAPQIFGLSPTAPGYQVQNSLSASATTTTVEVGETGKTAASVQSFTHTLKLGDLDQDVQQLQKFLNTHGAVVTESGGGSVGNETQFFGTLTFRALLRYQNLHADQILKPAGLTVGTGFFGAATRAYVNSVQ
ncbi:right-handed parallel beta-helix repeat-containing protein [Rhodoplanes sp. Z2-YC6860]|uniref:right-handed parallel beta-helix repeat-containing protein n=1 Tax=Rhodoplanes sp. Z2-YC6860 TaxID=674703 RepID=UPI00078E7448|nr:right-handed parallel beta-helix repeat-containing protein [Rhodoplanes sp. Z2-YC6860]AMN44723.1 parallel beta-helix repeat-containing protein [Rhodoplanes sp. Z2-YC6860]